MCSIGEDDFGDEGGAHAMIKDDQLSEDAIKEICSKCNAKGFLIKLKFREPECKTCFLAYTRHKFRAALGSSKILPKGAQVLLLFDGSAESLVLLDMMQYSQRQNTHKRLHVDTKLLFIDESSITKETNLSEIKKFLSTYDFEAFIISLADKDSLCKLDELDKYLQLKSNENSFTESLNSIKTLTSRQDFLKVWKNRMIAIVANQLKCNFVFTPDISSNLATELLNSISLGRGSSTALDVSLLDDRMPGLKIIRPLRNLNESEVNFYLQLNGLKILKSESYGAVCGSSASIQNLTKRFVQDLQTNFSSTISTIFRTGDKIAPNSFNDHSRDAEKGICTFCNSELDYSISKTLRAIEFSRLASAASGELETCKKEVMLNDNQSTRRSLCHACINIQNDCEKLDLIG